MASTRSRRRDDDDDDGPVLARRSAYRRRRRRRCRHVIRGSLRNYSEKIPGMSIHSGRRREVVGVGGREGGAGSVRSAIEALRPLR